MFTLSENNRGVPAATIPTTTLFWPIPTRVRSVPTRGGRSFGTTRGNRVSTVNGERVITQGTRYHAGVDLYGAEGDIIVAPQDCEIINFYHFYNGTYALFVKTDNQVFNIGEVQRDSLSRLGLKSPKVRFKPGRTVTTPLPANATDLLVSVVGTGSTVKGGEPLGIMGKPIRSAMLHFEIYATGTDRNSPWRRTGTPGSLRDPTPYLFAILEQDAVRQEAEAVSRAEIEATSENPRTAICTL